MERREENERMGKRKKLEILEYNGREWEKMEWNVRVVLPCVR